MESSRILYTQPFLGKLGLNAFQEQHIKCRSLAHTGDAIRHISGNGAPA